MINLLEARFLPRLGLATGIFLLWSVAFFLLVRPMESPAENLVLVPVMVSAILFGVRGGLVGSLIGVMGISTFHVIAGTGPFTNLLHGGSLADVVEMFAVAAMVGYTGQLETRRASASRLATSTQDRLDRLDTESQLLSRLSAEVGKSLAVDSVLAAAHGALSGVITFNRMAVYLLDNERGTAQLRYLSGEDDNGPATGDQFSIDEIRMIDPYNRADIEPTGSKAGYAHELQPVQIVNRMICHGDDPIGYLRIWSNIPLELSGREKNFVRSVAIQIAPAVARACLNEKIERDARINAVVAEFAAATHKSLEVAEVVSAATAHITRGIKHDFFAIAVADIDGRKIEVQHVIGEEVKGFEIGDCRTMKQAQADPLTDDEIRVWSVEECHLIKNHSQIAASVVESHFNSFMVINLHHESELMAQLWIGSKKKAAISPDDVEFATRVGHHLISALVNARISESLQELQRQFVGHNEQFAYMQDVVERAEAELRLSNHKLAELSESKTLFMSAVAHELKTPLSIIIGYANLLRFDPDNLNDEQREFATLVEKSARRLVAMADDLGDVSKMNSGKFSITRTPHDISAVIKSVVDDFRNSDPTVEHRLEYSAPSAVQIFNGDPVRLTQVFTNLITNALKYSSEDRSVEVTVDSGPEQFRISVTDYGLGISESDQRNLFTPFFRSTNPEALQHTGTGLGLVLVKSIVEQHGGNLTMSSELGSGSTFTVELPVTMKVEEALSA